MSAHCMFCVLARSVSGEISHAFFLPVFMGLGLDCLGFSHCVFSCFPTLFSLLEWAPSRQHLFPLLSPPPLALVIKAPRAFAVGTVTVNFLFFLFASRSQLSLCRSWLREPHRFLELKSST